MKHQHALLIASALLLGFASAAQAAIAIDITTSTSRSTQGTTIATTAFTTAAGNELLLAFVAADDSSPGGQSVTGVTGATLTWQLVVRTATQRGTSEIWRTFAPGQLAGAAVTATLAQSAAASLTVVSFTGADTSGTNGSGAIGAIKSASAASGAPSASLITTRNNSWVFGVGNDWSDATARTLGSGQTMVNQYLATVGDTFWVQRTTNATPAAGTTATIDDTAPAGDQYNLSVCEILPSGTGSTPTWSLSGTISTATAGTGTTLTLSGAASATATADAAGYSFTGLANGTYLVTPAKTGFTFAPPTRSATVTGANVSGINFTAQPLSDTIPPTVAITSPGTGAAVAGSTLVSAAASDNVGVAGVQFRLDGSNLGPEASPPYSVSWDTTAASNGAHTLTAIARDAAGNQTTSPAVAVNVSNGGNQATVGSWSAPFELGLVAVNAVMMHTGKVLMYSGSFSTSYVERVWDPATGTSTMVPNPFFNLFCSGHSQLADGRILVVGGFDSGSLGAANANIFDPVTLTWSALHNMAYRRWYPTATTLPNGSVLVTSGGQTCLTCLADIPEVFDPSTGLFSKLNAARLAVPYYPFMYVLPDGSVIDAGANESEVATTRLNVASQTWTSVDPVVRDGHSSAMYVPGKILKSGTAADSGTSGTAAATAFVLDTTQPSPAWRQVASMANRRAFHNTTLLPDGTVLVTGGGTTLDGHNVGNAVFAAEVWSPLTETWRTLASSSIPRLYHSTALLLPDGRVLSAGSGNDSGAVDQTRGQFFSPPYLFKGARPTITSAPASAQYDSLITLQTPDAASITAVSLIRPGAVTHAFDEDQRFLALTFTAGPDTLSVRAPANANLAPPGYYMLFIVNANGVPSIAPFVRLLSPAGDVQPPTSPAMLVAQGGLGAAVLNWTAATDNTGVTGYNVHRSTTAGVLPTAVNTIGVSTSTTFTDNVSAGTYFYVVTAEDVAGNVSNGSNEAMAIVLSDMTAPTVTITAPVTTTLSGLVSVSAAASDNVGVAGVQFKLDGAALGAEKLAPPYTITWNTATTANGPHVLSATARDASGNTAQATLDVAVTNASQTPSGLVASYSFNEGVGVLTGDASGQSNTGTLSSATWTTAGRFGSALSFNGTSSWVTVADASALDLTNAMTLEAWVNPTAGTGWRTVVLKEGPGILSYSLYSSDNGSHPVGYVRLGNADVAAPGTAAVALNVWTHLAVTYDGVTERLYVNGTLVTSTAATGAAPGTTGALRIGGNSVWGEYFRGLIDEVRVYNRPLSASEIQADMNTPITP